MLSCERKSGDLHSGIPSPGIPSHWDQSFVIDNEDDERLRRLSDELLARFRLRTDPKERTGGAGNADDGPGGRSYVNVPRGCPDRLVIPETAGSAAAGSVLLKTDLSPVSPRSRTVVSVGPAWSSAAARLAVARLTESGFYYGSISPTQARRILEPHPPGTYLVRDSSDLQRFLFSITLKTAECASSGRASTSVRIELLETGRFRLDGEKPGAHRLPSSRCVLDLLRRHTADGAVGRAEFVLLDGGRETPLMLRRPLHRDGRPSTLKHLCRRRIHSALDGRSVDRLHLVPSLKQYLKDYPSDL